MMNSLKKKIYIAKRIIDDSAVTKYETPLLYYFNVQPVNGNNELLAYGERIFSMFKTVINLKQYEGVFNEGDVVYLNGENPEGEEVNGWKANYVITSVRPQNKAITIYFDKIQK